MFSTRGVSLSTPRDTIMCGGYHEPSGGVQYTGGYHEYTGGYHDECGGYLEHTGGCLVHWGFHTNSIVFPMTFPHIYHDTPRYTHDIPRCTEHPRCTAHPRSTPQTLCKVVSIFSLRWCKINHFAKGNLRKIQ